MPIKAKEVDTLTLNEGEWVRHMVGIPCFCIDKHGQLTPNCRKHDVMGRIYVSDTKIKALVGGMNNHKEWIQAGIAYPGDCVLSPLTKDTVSAGDKIIFSWPEPFGEGDQLQRDVDDADLLTYEAIKALYCVDEKLVYYKQERDFIFNGKKIVWRWVGKPAEGKTPNIGVRYTVKYKGLLEYIAFDAPVERVSAGVDIGSKVLLRRLHLARGNG